MFLENVLLNRQGCFEQCPFTNSRGTQFLVAQKRALFEVRSGMVHERFGVSTLTLRKMSFTCCFKVPIGGGKLSNKTTVLFVHIPLSNSTLLTFKEHMPYYITFGYYFFWFIL